MSDIEQQKTTFIDQKDILTIPVVSVDVLPPNAKYRLVDMVNFQSTLGTGIFSEFGSDISNIFGTEAKMMNKKIDRSIGKCKDALRVLAYQIGANAVIGANFDFSTNTRDATTVAAHGTAVFIENIDQIFHRAVDRNLFVAFDGERKVSNLSYQLFLTNTYNIEKNNVLDKYVIGNLVYDNINLALAAAAERHQAVIDEIEAQRATIPNANITNEAAALMIELGITFDGEKFIYDIYRYDKVEDAINYAKKQAK